MATTGHVEQLAAEVLAQLDQAQTVDTLANAFARLDLNEAYQVQLALVAQRCARGERIIGRKVAFTSRGTMTQFGVTESAFGTILSGGVFADGETVPVSRFPSVGAEAEVAFVIGEELKGPGVTIAQALKATTGVIPAMEIINLCITHTPWNAVEVVATNAVHGGIVLGGQITPLNGLNLRYEGMVAEVVGEQSLQRSSLSLPGRESREGARRRRLFLLTQPLSPIEGEGKLCQITPSLHLTPSPTRVPAGSYR
jgi:2-keto-4-pentenoate hydratase